MAKRGRPRKRLATDQTEWRRQYQRNYYQMHKEKAKEYQRLYNLQHKKKRGGRGKAIFMEPREARKTSYSGFNLQNLEPEKFARVVNGIIDAELVLAN